MKITLEAARKNKGLSLVKAAEQIGVHRNTLWNYENGKSSPKVSTLEKLCKVYKCSPKDIFF